MSGLCHAKFSSPQHLRFLSLVFSDVWKKMKIAHFQVYPRSKVSINESHVCIERVGGSLSRVSLIPGGRYSHLSILTCRWRSGAAKVVGLGLRLLFWASVRLEAAGVRLPIGYLSPAAKKNNERWNRGGSCRQTSPFYQQQSCQRGNRRTTLGFAQVSFWIKGTLACFLWALWNV